MSPTARRPSRGGDDRPCWLAPRTAGAPVRIGPPGDIGTGEPVVAAWPLELRPTMGPGAGSGCRCGWSCSLVCASGAVDEATRLLDRVLVASARDGAGRGARTAAAADLAGLRRQATPGAAFRRTGADRAPYADRPAGTPPLQVQPADSGAARAHPGSGRRPLSDMRVEIASTAATAHTDSNGRFVLAGVPAGGRPACGSAAGSVPARGG
jgi:hypothetical protein